MNPSSFKDFIERISKPATPVPEMVELLRRAAPWEPLPENRDETSQLGTVPGDAS
jgi:hypothetical protein